jgi:hypothetical protein
MVSYSSNPLKLLVLPTKLAPTTQEQTHEPETMACAAIATTNTLETQ